MKIKKAGGQAEAVGAELSSIDGIKALISSVDKVFGGKLGGGLDILVINTGTVDRDLFLDSSGQSYDKHFGLNVRRPVLELSKDAAKRMVEARWGRIINIGSAFGEAAPLGGCLSLHRHENRCSRLHTRLIS